MIQPKSFMTSSAVIVFLQLAFLSGSFAHAASNDHVAHEEMGKATETWKTAIPSALPSHQTEELQKDGPILDMLVGEQAIYLIGQKSLWVLDVDKPSLKRINLIETGEQEGLRQLATDGVDLYVSSEHSLFKVRLQPFKILRYYNPLKQAGTSLALFGRGDHFYWLHSEALFLVDRYGNKIQPRIKGNVLSSHSHLDYSPTQRAIFSTQQRDVFKTSGLAKDKTPKTKRFYRAHHKIQQMFLDDDLITLVTANAIVLLDYNSKILKTIPVKSGRNLISSRINSKQHIFLFEDGLLEIFKPDTLQIVRSALPKISAKQIQVELHKNFITLLADNQFYLYELQSKERVE